MILQRKSSSLLTFSSFNSSPLFSCPITSFHEIKDINLDSLCSGTGSLVEIHDPSTPSELFLPSNSGLQSIFVPLSFFLYLYLFFSLTLFSVKIRSLLFCHSAIWFNAEHCQRVFANAGITIICFYHSMTQDSPQTPSCLLTPPPPPTLARASVTLLS